MRKVHSWVVLLSLLVCRHTWLNAIECAYAGIIVALMTSLFFQSPNGRLAKEESERAALRDRATTRLQHLVRKDRPDQIFL